MLVLTLSYLKKVPSFSMHTLIMGISLERCRAHAGVIVCLFVPVLYVFCEPMFRASNGLKTPKEGDVEGAMISHLFSRVSKVLDHSI